MGTLRHRLDRDDGFTLIELVIVIVIIGVLLAIAVMSYSGFANRARDTKAEVNIRDALPSIEAYYVDQDPTSYAGLGVGVLAAGYDKGIDRGLTIRPEAGGSHYCVAEAGRNGVTYYLFGPGGNVNTVLADSGPPGSTPTCS